MCYCNTVQYLQIVQMKSYLYSWGVEVSTIFICYVSEVKLVQMRGGTQYCIHLL